VIARAFDPFFTTKPISLGTGLGHSMVCGFARQFGGQVRIYSEAGEGTTVRLYLPRHRGEKEEGDVDGEPRRAPRAEASDTVLVVDDEPTVRMLVAEVLEDLGYAAVEVADGASGLHVLQSDARIAPLITDVGLPGGMNGRQLAGAGKARRAQGVIPHRLRGERGRGQRPPGARYAGGGQALHHGGARDPHPRHDRSRPALTDASTSNVSSAVSALI
jgi:hypothetical protein